LEHIAGKNRLIFIIAVLLAAGFFVTNLISYKTAKQSLRSDIINTSLPLTRDNIYSEIQRDLMKPIFIASSMANDTFVRDWTISGEKEEESIQKYLNHIMTKYSFFTTFFVSENTKNYYYYNGILKQISKDDAHDKWYYNFVAKHIPYALEVDENQAANNRLTIFINHRVYDYSHNLLGVTGVGLDVERITNMLSEYQVKYDREIYLVDTRGDIQIRSKNISLKDKNIRNSEGIREYADQLLSVSQLYSNFEYNSDGVHYLLTSRYVPELDWFLVVVQNQNTAMKSIQANFFKNLLFGLLVTVVVMVIISFAVGYYQRQLESIAATDHLTGTFNRREFSRIFEATVAKNKRYGTGFCMVLFDIDYFKDINDSFGHLTGDKIIARVSEITASCIRNTDMLARWGGDEFIILTQGTMTSSIQIAERINEHVRTDSVILSLLEGTKVTLSIGISEFTEGDTETTITNRADKALYRAKDNGRSRIETD